MNGSEQKYRLDDYLQDKAARSLPPLSTKASPFTRKEIYSPYKWERPATVVNIPSKVIVRPPHTVPKPTSGTVYVEKTDTGGSAGGGTLTQSQMTTAYTKQLLENALSDLLAMQNRKFKYDAHSSPLYSIVQKQAEENARLASGRAYAQAKAATGGYGSSYATLAADEAGRQAMRELDDQQLALYEAARAEFEAENASALDWYNTVNQLYEDQKRAELEGTQIMTDAINSLRERYGAEYVEEAMRADLSAMGLTEEQIGRALANQKQYSDAIGAYTNKTQSGVSDEVLAATQYLQSKYGSTYSEAAMRAELQAAGYSKEDITNALRAQRKIASGKVMDYGAGTMDEALSWSSQLDLALRNGTLTESEYNQAKSENSAVIRAEVENAMKDEAKAAEYLLSAEQAVASGALLVEDYQKILITNAKAELKEIKDGKGTDLKKAKKVLAVVNAILADVDNRIMTEEEAYVVIQEIARTSAGRAAYERISEIGNSDKENIRRLDKEEEEAYRALATARGTNRTRG